MALLLPSDISKALKQTSKGKLVYNRDESFEAIWNETKPDLRLISIHPSCLRSKSCDNSPLNKTNTDETTTNKINCNRYCTKENDYQVDESPLKNTEEMPKKIISPTIVDDLIREYETNQRENVEKLFEEKRNIYKLNKETLYRNSSLTLHSIKLEKTREEYLKSSLIASKMEARQLNFEKKIGKLKTLYKTKAKESVDRLEEASLKDEIDAEETRKRVLEIERRMNEIASSRSNLCKAYNEITVLLDSKENLKLLPDNRKHTVHSINDLMNQYQQVLRQFYGRVPEQKDVDLIHNLEVKAVNLFETFKTSIETAKKGIEEKQALAMNSVNNTIENVSNSDNINTNIAIKKGETKIGNDSDAFEKYQNCILKKETAHEVGESMKSDLSLKTFRIDLQNVIGLTVNAISLQSGAHLMEKILKLSDLLGGQQVTVMNRSNRKVSVLSHPNGKIYCLDYLAKKLVAQGAEQVASRPCSAFPIASVIIGLWNIDKAFGDFFLVHLYSKCPHLIPFRISRLEGQEENHYKMVLGYEKTDKGLESDEMFLKRISGIARLYAAVMVSPVPPITPSQHPMPINHAWNWIARTINMEPIPIVTASSLFNVLDVCGSLLMETYGKQFQKILRIIYQEYLPKIHAVTPPGFQSITSRLEVFLQTIFEQGRILPPEGALPSNFWMT